MQSRMEKYYPENDSLTRTEKHENTYKEVYGIDYDNYESLPIPDNANEIDLSKLKNIITSRSDYHQTGRKETVIKEETIISEPKTHEEKIYDINKLIEKARSEKEKLQEVTQRIIDTNYNFLMTLDTNEVKETNKVGDNPEIEVKTTTLSLDILSDLKPTENDTVVSTPIEQEDTKKETTVEEDFYSNQYSFNSNDFLVDKNSKSNIFFTVFITIIILIILVLGTYMLLKHFNIIL